MSLPFNFQGSIAIGGDAVPLDGVIKSLIAALVAEGAKGIEQVQNVIAFRGITHATLSPLRRESCSLGC